ncbi:hypothetical protein PHLGIDRAFT_10220 [Phlebiopsis gigantea 11061_1 CR5-6]|uniref:Uncharacterized protein n=1 Tax=Phlebiopsis gigantea (strain 11061_1 CR5-6) TaxID=745531 RepID=A0A0C3P2K4_PHLG1|nr:hypothetical protein PHLGIDRAFT_10220 [Phlebiopsis gigantea 11061_1 CR5-6]
MVQRFRADEFRPPSPGLHALIVPFSLAAIAGAVVPDAELAAQVLKGVLARADALTGTRQAGCSDLGVRASRRVGARVGVRAGGGSSRRPNGRAGADAPRLVSERAGVSACMGVVGQAGERLGDRAWTQACVRVGLRACMYE